MTGTIVRKTDKGFGFIQPDDGSKDVFFHASNVADGMFDELAEGEKVTFEIEEGPKGPAAKDIRRAA
jgi:CspA family cold shock protein